MFPCIKGGSSLVTTQGAQTSQSCRIRAVREKIPQDHIVKLHAFTLEYRQDKRNATDFRLESILCCIVMNKYDLFRSKFSCLIGCIALAYITGYEDARLATYWGSENE